MSIERNERVDLLRFIGLAMIVLAHVEPPPALAQLRNFDVPLMVLVSGIAFGLSYRGESFGAYVWKRIKRLVLPVWIFLTGLFVVVALTGLPMPWPGTGKVVSSYLLLAGIGYVWIIRVFLLVALVAPWLSLWNRHTASSGRYLGVLAAAYAGYEALLWLSRPFLGSLPGRLFEASVLNLVPYAIVFAIGLRLTQWTPRQVGRGAMAALAVCAALAVLFFAPTGLAVPTQAFKYPPGLYYLSYALGVALLLWLASPWLWARVKHAGLAAPILFIAQNSIWIYLWHIPFIEMLRLHWAPKYVIVFAAASLVTWLQVRCVQKLVLPRVENATARRNVNLLLTG